MRVLVSVTAAASIVTFLVVAGSLAGPDKIAYPANYKSQVLYAKSDRPDNKTIRDLYAPADVVKQAAAGKPLPNGTVLTMEVYKAKVDDKGELVKDTSGKLIKGDLSFIGVMEKRSGWGAEYPDSLRNGEWEYAVFETDMKPRANLNTKPCLECHKPFAAQDFVFTFSQLVEAGKK